MRVFACPLAPSFRALITKMVDKSETGNAPAMPGHPQRYPICSSSLHDRRDSRSSGVDTVVIHHQLHLPIHATHLARHRIRTGRQHGMSSDGVDDVRVLFLCKLVYQFCRLQYRARVNDAHVAHIVRFGRYGCVGRRS